MSYSLHNPHPSEGKNASQGQNELVSGQRERDLRGIIPHLGPESCLNFPGLSYETPALFGGGVTAQRSLPLGHRPEVGGTALNPNLNRTLNLNICAKDELKHQHVSQNAFNNQTAVLPSSATLSSVGSSVLTVLKNYGLDLDDLDEILNYPDDQTTSENLPHIIEEIRLKKAARAAASVQSNFSSTAQPAASVAIPKTCLQPSKETAYGLSGKPEDRIAKSICCTPKTDENILPSCSFKNSSHSEEVPESGSSGLVPSNDQSGPIDSLTPKGNVVAPLNSDVAGTPNQTSQTIFTTSSLPNEAQDTTMTNPEDVMFVSTKETVPGSFEDIIYVSSGESSLDSAPSEEPICHFAAKTLPTSSLDQKVNSTQSVAHLGRNEDTFANNERETQSSKVVKTTVIQQTQKSVAKPSRFQMWQNFMSNSEPLPSFVSTIAYTSHPVQFFAPMVNDPNSCIVSPSRPALGQAYATSVPHSAAKNPTSKGLPSREMMTDYAAAQPKTFPHTCSLCKKKCAQLKVS